jgi:ABC-type amino acid transport system permease subunit
MGVLNKKIWQVPEREPYTFNINKAIAWVLFIITVCGLIIALSSCSIEKKVAKTYRNAEIYNPLTREDSLHLIRASKKVIKPLAPKVLPAKTITVKVPVKTYVLDSVRLMEIEDSLGIYVAENINNIVDDCIKSVNQAKKEALLLGIKEGYNQRNKELKKDSLQITIPPEVQTPDLELIAELNDCRLSFRIKEDSCLVYRTLMIDKKKQAKDRLWLILLLSILLGASFFFNIKGAFTKLKIPSA